MKKVVFLFLTSILFGYNLYNVIDIEHTLEPIDVYSGIEYPGFRIISLCDEKTIHIKKISVYPKQCIKNIIHTKFISGKLSNIALKPYEEYVILYKPDKKCKSINLIKILDQNDLTATYKFEDNPLKVPSVLVK